MAGKLTGVQKAAIVLIALGADLSAKVLKHFPEDEIEMLTQHISMLESVPKEVQQSVLEEFLELSQARDYLLHGGYKYAREVLEKAVGPQRAEEILNKVSVAIQNVPFSGLRRTDARHLLNFIRDEHPQTIALIITHLVPEQAALILSALPPEKQADIARRVAVIDRISPEVVKEVERVLERKMSMVVQQDQAVGGIKTLVNILNRVDRSTEKTILEELEVSDPDLADEVRKMMFVFEDIIKLHDSAIQRVLREVDTKDLAKAMRGANEEVNERIFKNMSRRAGDMLREEIQYMGPVRLRDVEEAQQRIVQIIRRLDETGEIIIARGGEDAIVI
ncbi:flagellar motor switch protein FliG [Desulfofundulus thermobenzoicus]|uniref:Flagellar motor switch protein FliG n=1 Tax=Desulfofundulus thermobenzoicus TaxID=29376 RepID=A0A6N7INC1_9FIRM|nr:flagellar motor switch protein FliG [Desulfofundulus thermobenzoicus]MQL51434.1 flagellar motor switch protein FliG [Desulfofundulus thermobenzoicus]HHW45028.1 flagellar motor switch protein FliG [Desulfotomaculum sp.]